MTIHFISRRREIFGMFLPGCHTLVLICCFLRSFSAAAETRYEATGGVSAGIVSTDDPAAKTRRSSFVKTSGDFSADVPSANGHETWGLTAARSDQLTEASAFETVSARLASERSTSRWTLKEKIEGGWSRTQEGFYQSAFADEMSQSGQNHSFSLVGEGLYALEQNYGLIVGASGSKYWADSWSETVSGHGGVGWQVSPILNWSLVASRSVYMDGRDQRDSSTMAMARYQYDWTATALLSGHIGRVMIQADEKMTGANVGMVRVRKEWVHGSWTLDGARSVQSGLRQGGVYLEDDANLRVEFNQANSWRSAGLIRWSRQHAVGHQEDLLRGGRIMLEFAESVFQGKHSGSAVGTVEVTEVVTCDFVRYPAVYRTCMGELGLMARL